MSYGAMYLSARDAGRFCRELAAETARDCPRQQAALQSSAAYHQQRADEIRAQLAAARKLGLGGSAGQLPRSYHADAPQPSHL